MLQGSGEISIEDIAQEFIPGWESGMPISLEDFYPSTSANAIVQKKGADNSAADLAAGLPEAGEISFDDFYSKARGWKYTATSTNVNVQTIYGEDYYREYPKEVLIPAGVSISTVRTGTCVNFPSNAPGDWKVTVNGTLTSNGGECISNHTGSTIDVVGTGSISATDRDDFKPEWQPSGSSYSGRVNLVGGFGGASGPDFYHSDYGGGFNCKVTRRSDNRFFLYWTYNECDYANLGGGSLEITAAMALAGDGYMRQDGSQGHVSSQVAANGRDSRNVSVGSELRGGVREIWFCSNNKSTSLELNNNRYIQYGHAQTALTPSNSRRGIFYQEYPGFSISGPHDRGGFSGSFQGATK